MILNHGSETPLWLSPSPLQRDDKPVSSVIAFFFLFLPPASPQQHPGPAGAPQPPRHTPLPWHTARACWKRGSLAPSRHSTRSGKGILLISHCWGPQKWQQAQDLHRGAELNVLAGVAANLSPPRHDQHGSPWCQSPQSLGCAQLPGTFPGAACPPRMAMSPLQLRWHLAPSLYLGRGGDH